MLEKLLREINDGGTLEVSELAVRLGTSTNMVTAMLEYLSRTNYIQPYKQCTDSCAGCSLIKECKQKSEGDVPDKNIRIYTLTEPVKAMPDPQDEAASRENE